MEVEEYFWAKVDFDTHDEDRCWPWTGQILRNGYGQLHLRVAGNPKVMAHRLAYVLEVGDIPDDSEIRYEVDHKCHDASVCKLRGDCPHRRCCNPSHLEVVTKTENIRRAAPNLGPVPFQNAHCPNNHEWSEENTRFYRNTRHCRACDRERTRKDRAAGRRRLHKRVV